jgi:hypothetical protein
MDGRVQIPVIEFLRERFGVDNVDIVSESGPVLYLSEHKDSEEAKSIIRRVNISIDAHDSQGIAIIAHESCAGNPSSGALQRKQLYKAVTYTATLYPGKEVVGLWVDDDWKVNEICTVEGCEEVEDDSR